MVHAGEGQGKAKKKATEAADAAAGSESIAKLFSKAAARAPSMAR